MTLPQNVKDALGELDAAHDQRFAPWRNQWQTIRAHLMNQEAEIDELVRALTMCTGRAKRAESRLAAADALLRKCRDEFAAIPRSLGYDFTHLPEIDAHLQGAGDEL